MRCLVLLGLCGCELYFTDPKDVPPDANVKPTPVDAKVACPSDPPPPGLTGEILFPADGATNVASPVQVVYRWSTTNQDARKAAMFCDNATRSCTTHPVPCPSGTEGACLKPNTKYTFRLFWVCYAGVGPHPVFAEITFTSAP